MGKVSNIFLWKSLRERFCPVSACSASAVPFSCPKRYFKMALFAESIAFASQINGSFTVLGVPTCGVISRGGVEKNL